MCFASTAAPEPEPIQKPAEYADPQVTAARQDSNRRNRSAAGAQSTILSRLMAPAAGTGAKTLMGQ